MSGWLRSQPRGGASRAPTCRSERIAGGTETSFGRVPKKPCATRLLSPVNRGHGAGDGIDHLLHDDLPGRVRDRDRLKLAQRLQVPRQVVRLRRCCARQDDNDRFVGFQKCPDFHSHGVALVVKPGPTGAGIGVEPTAADEHHTDSTVTKRPLDRLLPHVSGHHVFHIHEDTPGSQVLAQLAVQTAGRPRGVVATVGDEDVRSLGQGAEQEVAELAGPRGPRQREPKELVA